MSYDIEPTIETGVPVNRSSNGGNISLQNAIDFGEYDPAYLAGFPEWHNLSTHIQWQLIRKALDTRHRQLITHYAELSNSLELSKKPHIQKAMKNLEVELSRHARDKEDLYVEYSSML